MSIPVWILSALAASTSVGGPMALHNEPQMATSQSRPLAERGRLTARPQGDRRPAGTVQAGETPLGLGQDRDGRIFVPKGIDTSRPAPLVLLLHGAGADGAGILGILRQEAEAAGAIVVAPDSRGSTWDVIRGGFGPDVDFIDRALRLAFERHLIDPSRVSIAGFSDGASYALSLGLTNGDLFDAVLAFSPGFSAPASFEGKPRIFVSHGEADRVLPIDRCSHRIVPVLEAKGYPLRFVPFAGGHSVPGRIAKAGMEWALAPAQR